MGITRLAVLVAVIWVLWFLVKRFQLSLLKRTEVIVKQNQVIKKKQLVSNVKECAYCDVHVPETEAIESEGLYFCCMSHLKSYTFDE